MKYCGSLISVAVAADGLIFRCFVLSYQDLTQKFIAGCGAIAMNENDLDHAYCTLHNLGAQLSGNTQASDLEWFAQSLFNASRLGAADIKTVEWLIGFEQWEKLGLTPQALLGDGAYHWESLEESDRDAWRKLARICMYMLPAIAERIGDRMMAQARAVRVVWKQESFGGDRHE